MLCRSAYITQFSYTQKMGTIHHTRDDIHVPGFLFAREPENKANNDVWGWMVLISMS